MKHWILICLLCLSGGALLLPSCTNPAPNESVAEKGSETTKEVVTDSSDASGEPTKEPAKEPAQEPSKEPAKEPVQEPAKEPVVEGDAGMEPTPDKVSEPTPDKVSEPTPDKVTEPTPDNPPKEVKPEPTPETKPDNPPAPTIPTDKTGLFNWLKAGKFLGWKKESKVHPAIAIHSAQARVFINNLLDGSLKAGAKKHPIGAASVKELYDSTGKTLRGWALMLKVANNGNAQDWYWYEVLSTTSGANPVAAGRGVGLCAGCHSSGIDSFRSPYPLK